MLEYSSDGCFFSPKVSKKKGVHNSLAFSLLHIAEGWTRWSLKPLLTSLCNGDMKAFPFEVRKREVFAFGVLPQGKEKKPHIKEIAWSDLSFGGKELGVC